MPHQVGGQFGHHDGEAARLDGEIAGFAVLLAGFAASAFATSPVVQFAFWAQLVAYAVAGAGPFG